MQSRSSQSVSYNHDLAPSGQHDLGARYQFIGLAESDLQELLAFWPILEAELSTVLDAFIAHSMTVPTAAKHMRGNEEKFRESQSLQWWALFTGGFDANYFKAT